MMSVPKNKHKQKNLIITINMRGIMPTVLKKKKKKEDELLEPAQVVKH